jgi:hypothetical protein
MAEPPIKPNFVDENNQYVSPGLVPGEAEINRLPSLRDLGDLSLAELSRQLQLYGITPEFERIISEAATQYIGRLHSLGPAIMSNQAAMDAEVERIATGGSKRAMLTRARRAQQMWSTLDAADGNMNAEFISISEDDERVCDNCIDLAGEIYTLAEWQAIGHPGFVCLGGGMCRCDLVRVD